MINSCGQSNNGSNNNSNHQLGWIPIDGFHEEYDTINEDRNSDDADNGFYDNCLPLM